MSYVIKAVLSNPRRPECGQITIPFPIPDDQYDSTIDLLHGIGIGDATAQDCRVVGLEGLYPTLKRLNGQAINVDELDYLAKRLDSFSDGEDAQFEAMAFKLGLSSIKDFINLTFCCQQATVITDFSDPGANRQRPQHEHQWRFDTHGGVPGAGRPEHRPRPHPERRRGGHPLRRGLR